MIETDLKKYLHKQMECDCKRMHHTKLKEIEIGAGVLNRVPALIKKYNFRKIALIADRNTYQAAGALLVSLLNDKDIDNKTYIFEDACLIPDETAVGKIITFVEADCDLILAVGAGTINDLCKFVSCRLQMQYFIIATAPSMDGFASTVAPLIVNNMKITYDAHVPAAIIGDVNIMKQAPFQMLQAGVGDILGKYTCLCDWRLAHMVTGEYYCETLADMIRRSIQKVVDHIEKLMERDPKAVESVMEALVLSGIAMSFAGNSRPASGSEHHLAHYLEILFLMKKRKAYLHGIKVGVGTYVTVMLYHLVRNKGIDFKIAKQKAHNRNTALWEEEIRNAYEILAGQVIGLEKSTGKNSHNQVIKRIQRIEEILPDILHMIDEELPKADDIKRLLNLIEAPVTPKEIQVSDELLVNAIRYAKDIRNRYGLLQFMFDLDIIDAVSLQAAVTMY